MYSDHSVPKNRLQLILQSEFCKSSALSKRKRKKEVPFCYSSLSLWASNQRPGPQSLLEPEWCPRLGVGSFLTLSGTGWFWLVPGRSSLGPACCSGLKISEINSRSASGSFQNHTQRCCCEETWIWADTVKLSGQSLGPHLRCWVSALLPLSGAPFPSVGILLESLPPLASRTLTHPHQGPTAFGDFCESCRG